MLTLRGFWAPGLVAGFATAALCGCTINSRGAAEPMVYSRAAKDLECAQSDIRLEAMELGNRYKARGCGKERTYRTACQALECTVAGDDDPAIPWRDRPAPDEFHR